MSISLVDPVVRRFVRGDHDAHGAGPGTDARTLALRGPWGVGKTFYWQRVVDERLEDRRYGYVSLFGLNSLEEVRSALVTALAVDWVPKGGLRKATRLVPKVTGAATTLFQNVPYMRTLSAAGGALAGALAFELVRDALLCFDDIERRGPELSMRDVLGLATRLRDERGCDVALILNDEQLDGTDGSRGDAAAFAAYGEKAIDYQVRFEPTVGEAFRIVYPGTEGRERATVEECCERLRIANVRVVQRIRRAVEELALHLDKRSDRAVDAVVRSAVLMTWGYYDRENAPEFARVRRPVSQFARMLHGSDKEDPEAKAWTDLLERYGYYPDSGLDQVIADYVERGYVDEDAFRDALDQIDREAEAGEERARYDEVWRLYRDSFEPNEDAFADALAEATRLYHRQLKVAEFNEAVVMLRKLNRGEAADDAVRDYVRALPDQGIKSVDAFYSRLFGDYPTDPVFEREALAALSAPKAEMTIEVALRHAAEYDPPGDGPASFLAEQTVEDLAEALRSLRGRELRGAVNWCLGTGGGVATRIELSKRTKEALRQIAADAPLLNRIRMEGMYSFDPFEDETTEEDSGDQQGNE